MRSSVARRAIASAIAVIVVRSDADEDEQPRADLPDDVAIDLHRGAGDALQERPHVIVWGGRIPCSADERLAPGVGLDQVGVARRPRGAR